MNVRLEITGTTPLLLKNGQGANPDHPMAKEIKTYTGKRTKTEDDRKKIAELEWFFGLYVSDSGELIYPTANIGRCLKESGKITKKGKAVERAVIFGDLEVPLVYDGPAEPKELFKEARFRDDRPVGIGMKRTMRTRPRFFPWSLVADAVLLEDVLDVEDFARIGQMAGRAIGLGDGRTLGFGRFIFAAKTIA